MKYPSNFLKRSVFLCLSLLAIRVPAIAGSETDPFAGLDAEKSAETIVAEKGFFEDNFGFRKEWMSEFSTKGRGESASRQSMGFEVQKKFSSATKTIFAVDFQGRYVRRDGFVDASNDAEGVSRSGNAFEYHNAYLDFYDLLFSPGSVNLRMGRFYLPFGLNNQTDTHGTLLQLSNEKNFGFERDWYAGFYGILNSDLHYDLDYLVGSGYGLKFKGQSGMLAARLSLANHFASDYGLEGGLSLLNGQRLSGMSEMDQTPTDTFRAGIDGRYRKAISSGLLTLTSELSLGHDSDKKVFTQLHEVNYLHQSRKWSLAEQFHAIQAQNSFATEATWFFSNDVSGSNLHWLKLNFENILTQMEGTKDVIWTLQYYRYW